MQSERPRSRLLQGCVCAAIIVLGLLSRSRQVGLPKFWAKYSGDGLWALMVFMLVGLLFPRRSTLTIAAIAFVYSCLTEFSQLYHAPWSDAIRRNPFGRLVLGDTFAWADIVAYLIGILVGAAVDHGLTHRAGSPRDLPSDRPT